MPEFNIKSIGNKALRANEQFVDKIGGADYREYVGSAIAGAESDASALDAYKSAARLALLVGSVGSIGVASKAARIARSTLSKGQPRITKFTDNLPGVSHLQ